MDLNPGGSGPGGAAAGSGAGVGGGGAKSHSALKYKCNVCEHYTRGCDLPRHYKNMTNWSVLAKLKQCVGDIAVEAQLAKTDPHTAFIFKNKYKIDNLPTWRTHALWKSPGARPGGDKKTKSDFF